MSRNDSRIISLICELNQPLLMQKMSGLRGLWELARNDEMKLRMCDPSFQLLPQLKGLLENTEQLEIIEKVTGILWYLARSDPASEIIGSKEIGLIPILVKLFRVGRSTVGGETYRNHLLRMFGNLNLAACNLNYLLSPEFRYLECFVEQRDPLDYHLIGNLAQTIWKEHLPAFIQSDICATIFQTLFKYGPNPLAWHERVGGPAYWCINTLVSISSLTDHAGSVILARIPNFTNYMTQLIRNQPLTMEALKAVIILANLSSSSEVKGDLDKEEENCYNILKQYALFSFDRLTVMLDVTINLPHRKEQFQELSSNGFNFAVISVSAMFLAMKNLLPFISPIDKSEEVYYNLRDISILLGFQAIVRFLQNEPGYEYFETYALEQAGGGGKDIKTFQEIIDLFIQFLFELENTNQPLSDHFPVYCLQQLSQVLDLPTDRKIDDITRMKVLLLLRKINADEI